MIRRMVRMVVDLARPHLARFGIPQRVLCERVGHDLLEKVELEDGNVIPASCLWCGRVS